RLRTAARWDREAEAAVEDRAGVRILLRRVLQERLRRGVAAVLVADQRQLEALQRGRVLLQQTALHRRARPQRVLVQLHDRNGGDEGLQEVRDQGEDHGHAEQGEEAQDQLRR